MQNCFRILLLCFIAFSATVYSFNSNSIKVNRLDYDKLTVKEQKTLQDWLTENQNHSYKEYGVSFLDSPQDPMLLHYAVRENYSIANLLLKAGWDINQQQGYGTTPLMDAVSEAKDVKMVNWLIDKGALLDLKNKGNNTALTLSAMRGICAITRILLATGANPNIFNQERETALMLTTQSFFYKSNNSKYAAEYYAMAQDLIAYGAHLNLQDTEGLTALMQAVYYRLLSLVKLFIESGADITLRNKRGETAYTIEPLEKNSEYGKILEYLKPFYEFRERAASIVPQCTYKLIHGTDAFPWFLKQAVLRKNPSNYDLKLLFDLYKNTHTLHKYTEYTKNADQKDLAIVRNLYNLGTFEEYDLKINYINMLKFHNSI